jgi:hypothetical protein
MPLWALHGRSPLKARWRQNDFIEIICKGEWERVASPDHWRESNMKKWMPRGQPPIDQNDRIVAPQCSSTIFGLCQASRPPLNPSPTHSSSGTP